MPVAITAGAHLLHTHTHGNLYQHCTLRLRLSLFTAVSPASYSSLFVVMTCHCCPVTTVIIFFNYVVTFRKLPLLLPTLPLQVPVPTLSKTTRHL